MNAYAFLVDARINSNFSFLAWMRPEDVGYNVHHPIMQMNNAAAINNLQIGLSRVSAGLRLYGDIDGDRIKSTIYLQNYENWNHFCWSFEYDASADMYLMYTYIDLASRESSRYFSNIHIPFHDIVSSAHEMFNDQGSGTAKYKGMISSIKIVQQALNPISSVASSAASVSVWDCAWNTYSSTC